MDYGLDPDFDPFSTSELVNINGNYFYKKPSVPSSVNSWNYLYGSAGLLLRLNLQAFSQNGEDYFPALGEDVPKNECNVACQRAQQKLNNVGLTHIDLFDGRGYYNCTNVRKVNGDYFPIDMIKITQKGGKLNYKKSKSRKSKKSKSRKSKKSKSRKNKRAKK
jgi:hypothetical protein